MIIEFLLATALDMSLPEFQPEVDLSGNYIVGTYDVSNDEIIVEEVPADEVPIEEPGGALRGLSPEPVPEDVIKPEIKMTRSNNIVTIESSSMVGWRINGTALGQHGGDTLYYIQLTADIEYTLYNYGTELNISYGLYKGAPVTTSTVGSTYTPSSNCYLLKNNASFYVTYTDGSSGGDTSGNEPGGDTSGNEPGGDTSGNEPGGDTSGNEPGDDTSGNEPGGNITADLTAVENKLDKLIVLLRSVLLVSAVSFLYPLIISVFNNIGGGKNV